MEKNQNNFFPVVHFHGNGGHNYNEDIIIMKKRTQVFLVLFNITFLIILCGKDNIFWGGGEYS